MINANEFYDELKKVDSRDKIFSVSFYGENFRESLYSTTNLKKAAIYYSENHDKVDHFTIDFWSNPYGGCNFVILDNFDKLINYNNEMYNMKNKNRNMKENKKSITLNESDKSKYMMSKLGKRVTQMIGSFVNSKEDEGVTYTREDILRGIKSSTDMLAKKYPAVTDRYVNNCISYFIKKYGKHLSFLIEGRNRKGRMLYEDVEEPIEDSPEVDVDSDFSSDEDDGRPEVEVIKTGRNRHGEFKVLRAKGGRYYIQYGEETYPVGSEHDAMKWAEILSIDESKHGKKETVKLNEGKIRKIVAEAVKRILKENDWRFDMMSNRGTKQDKIKRANSNLNQKYGMNQTRRFGTPENGGTLNTRVDGFITPSGTHAYLSHSQDAVKDGAEPQQNPAWVNGNTNDRMSSSTQASFEQGKNPMFLGGGSLANDGTNNYMQAGNEMQDYFSGNFKNRVGEKMKKLGNYNVMPDMGKNFRNVNENRKKGPRKK